MDADDLITTFTPVMWNGKSYYWMGLEVFDNGGTCLVDSKTGKIVEGPAADDLAIPPTLLRRLNAALEPEVWEE